MLPAAASRRRGHQLVIRRSGLPIVLKVLEGLFPCFPVQGFHMQETSAHQGKSRRQERGLDLLAEARPLPGEEGGAYRFRHAYPRRGVDQGTGPDPRRDIVDRLGLRSDHSGHGLDDHVVTGPVGVGTPASVGRELAVHQPRVERRQGVVVNSEFGGDVRPVVDQGDVHLGDQTGKYLLGRPLGKVQRQAAFAAVVGHERAAFGGLETLGQTPGLPPRRFHLDYVRSQIGQEFPSQRPGNYFGEVHHSDAVQRSRHGVSPPFR